MVDLPDGRRLPVAKVLEGAIALHQSGRLRRASELYRRILEIEPRQADALHLLGLTQRQLGNFARAVELMHAAIAINPRVAMYHSKLAQAYSAWGRAAEAETACRRAIALDPSLPEAHLNLGEALLLQQEYEGALEAYTKSLSLRPGYIDALLGQADALLQAGRHTLALESYQKALDLQPDNAAALTRFGITLRKLGRVEDAIRHYEAAIDRLPEIPELHNNIAILYQRVGRPDDASASLRRLLELAPDDAMAQHLLHALEGKTTECAPADYVRDIFDGYAETFESHLVQTLGYQTPELLAEAVYACVGSRSALSVLDLGCGTGLMGVELQERCTRLVGVDLAPKMVEKARAKGLYTELAAADIVEFMQASDATSYDLVIAADVFVYIGDLRAVFAESRRILGPGGLFAFSVEMADEGCMDFTLEKTGRYRHSAQYLRGLRDEFGFSEGYFSQKQIRVQGDQPVHGYLCVFTITDISH